MFDMGATSMQVMMLVKLRSSLVLMICRVQRVQRVHQRGPASHDKELVPQQAHSRANCHGLPAEVNTTPCFYTADIGELRALDKASRICSS